MTAPHTESVPIEKLIVDHQVQRLVDRKFVSRIVNDFRADALGVLVVSHRVDGTYHIIDGQHRVAALVASGQGDTNATCMVYTGLSLAEEAAMFRLLNTSRLVQPVDKFRVRVVEGDPAAVEMNAILNESGWRVEMVKHKGAFASVAAFEKVYKGFPGGAASTAAVCRQLMHIITEAWGHDADGVRAEIVYGIGSLLLRFQDRVDHVKLIQQLALIENGPRGLVSRARGLRAYQGGRISDAVATVAVGLINKGRRSNRLPDWHSVDGE